MTISYEGHIYRPAQLFRLIRDMSAQGWTVTLQCEAAPRRHGDPMPPNSYSFRATSSYGNLSRLGNTPWAAAARCLKGLNAMMA